MTGGWGTPRANPNRVRAERRGDIDEGPPSRDAPHEGPCRTDCQHDNEEKPR